MGKIYTKSGDSGTTTLVGGKRISKNDELLEAYGTCDELNSFIGLFLAETKCSGIEKDEADKIADIITDVQNTLFDIGGLLATEPEYWVEYWKNRPAIIEEKTVALEQQIDKWSETLPQIRQFILPGGSKATATAHVCRTVCRRLERQMVALNGRFKGYLTLTKYINRLSDFFFILSRFLHQIGNIPVNLYQPTK
ncbi:MAG: cob(I)yrinic acid a,c-diamide adenosyltransferase [Bacteroidales bacterium]|nr:cob(I)yrinic acid a,c-diamide adenosyltransferase [Bacteroidales bacterium]